MSDAIMDETANKDSSTVRISKPVSSNRVVKPRTVVGISSIHDSATVVSFEPHDGGWGWVVCFCSFVANGIIFSIINSFGVLMQDLKDRHKNVHHITFATSLVGSLAIGMTFLISPVSSILTEKLGLRLTAFLGGLLATVGMLSSSFVKSLQQMKFTYGFLVGTGFSLAYIPSLVILGHHFRRRLGIVNGIVTTGSPVFTVVLPLLLRYLLDTYHLDTTLQILSVITGALMICALAYRPVFFENERITEASEPTQEKNFLEECCPFVSPMIDTKIWRNPRYIIWVIAISVSLFGYFVPFVHITGYVKTILPSDKGETLIACLGFSSAFGRLLFGELADIPSVNIIAVLQVAVLSGGLLTMLIAVIRSFAGLVVIFLLLGLYDGCFISLLGPMAFKIVGHEHAAQALGFLLGLFSIPLATGATLAGLMYDYIGDYKRIFFISGVPHIVGAGILFLMYKYQEKIPKSTNRKTSTASPESRRKSASETDITT